MVKDNKPEPFGYLCDWGDTQDGMQRIAVYYGEPGNGVDDDWNEHPKVYKNLPILTLDQAEAYAAAKVREALEEAAKVCDEYWKELDGARRSGNIGKYIEGALDCADILEQRIKALIPSQTGDSNVATD